MTGHVQVGLAGLLGETPEPSARARLRALGAELAPARWVPGAGAVVARTLRRRRLRHALEAVHAGVDLVLPGDVPRDGAWPRSADPRALARLSRALWAGQVASVRSDDTVARALAARARELSEPLDAPRSASLDPARPHRVAHVVHTRLPAVRSGYTLRTRAVLAALEAGGLPGTLHALSDLPATGHASLDAHVDALAEALASQLPPDTTALHAASNWLVGLVALRAGARLGLPVTYEARGLWEVTHASLVPGYGRTPAYRFQSAMEARVARGSAHAFAICPDVADALRARESEIGSIGILPNGAEACPVEPRPDAAVVRIAYAGALVAYEGVGELLSALARLRADGHGCTLDIAGSGPEASRLQRRAARLGMGDGVTFHGPLPPERSAELVRAADIVVLARRDLAVCRMVEPLKPLEAMAAGAALVVTPLAPLARLGPAVVADGFGARDLARALEPLVADRPRLDKLRRRSRDWVADHRSWAQAVAPLLQTYGVERP